MALSTLELDSGLERYLLMPQFVVINGPLSFWSRLLSPHEFMFD